MLYLLLICFPWSVFWDVVCHIAGAANNEHAIAIQDVANRLATESCTE